MAALPASGIPLASPSSSPSSSLATASKPAHASLAPPSRPVRPSFNPLLTSDRLRMSSTSFVPPIIMPSRIPKDRKSIFRELGLDDETTTAATTTITYHSLPASPTSFDAEQLVGDVPATRGAGAVSAGPTTTTATISGATTAAMPLRSSLSLRSGKRTISSSTTTGTKTVEFELPPPPPPPPELLLQSRVNPTPGAVPRTATVLSSGRGPSTLETSATSNGPARSKAGGGRRWWPLGGISTASSSSHSGSRNSKRPSLKTASIFVLAAVSGLKRRAGSINPNTTSSSSSSNSNSSSSSSSRSIRLARSASRFSTTSRGGRKLRKRQTEPQIETPAAMEQRAAQSELGSGFTASMPPG